MIKDRFQSKGMLEIHTAVLLFSLAGLFGKFVTLPALVIVFGRTFFAALALGIISILRNTPLFPFSNKDRLIFLTIGALLALHWYTFFYAIQISTVATGLLTFSSFPIFVTILEPLFFKEKFRLTDGLFALIVSVGLLLVIPIYDLSNNLTQGVVWGTLSGFTFALLSLFNRKYVLQYPPLMLGLNQNAAASLVLIPLIFFEDWSLKFSDLMLLIILGVFCTALAHVLFIKSLATIKIQLASIITTLEPLYGILFAFLLLSEVPSQRTVFGGTLILGVVFIASRIKSTN
ncbi:MAG: EamA family transporter [Proteobacteria bacterium]|nr:EamA family transporter [Pseudomonadota bacterium]